MMCFTPCQADCLLTHGTFLEDLPFPELGQLPHFLSVLVLCVVISTVPAVFI